MSFDVVSRHDVEYRDDGTYAAFVNPPSALGQTVIFRDDGYRIMAVSFYVVAPFFVLYIESVDQRTVVADQIGRQVIHLDFHV